jgi:hypothetical protein
VSEQTLAAVQTSAGDFHLRIERQPEKSSVTKPTRSYFEEVKTHSFAAVEQVTQQFFATKNPGQRHRATSHDSERTFRRIRDGTVRIDGRNFQREFRAANASKFSGQNQQIRGVGERGERPGQRQREKETVRWIFVILDLCHFVLKRQQDPWIHFKGEVQVKGTVAAFLRMKVYFPGLAQRIRLDEVPLIVHMESMVVGGVVFEIGDVPGYVDDGHESSWSETKRNRRPLTAFDCDYMLVLHQPDRRVNATTAKMKSIGRKTAPSNHPYTQARNASKGKSESVAQVCGGSQR